MPPVGDSTSQKWYPGLHRETRQSEEMPSQYTQRAAETQVQTGSLPQCPPRRNTALFSRAVSSKAVKRGVRG